MMASTVGRHVAANKWKALENAMKHEFWERMHGGVTHFPLTLLVVSFGFDFIAFWWRGEARRREFQAAGFYSLLIAAAAAPFAVLSGLFLSHGEMLGQGSLRMHHLFIWPSFGLLTGLAVWRLVVRDRASRSWCKGYLVAAGIAAAAMLAGGYWGGEVVMGN
jgi:uncharacterized membrane protein